LEQRARLGVHLVRHRLGLRRRAMVRARVKVRVRARARVRVRVRGLGVHHGLAVAEPQLCVGVAGPAAELVQVVG